MFTITVIDYGMGNLWSVKNAINFLGYESNITSNLNEIENADLLILPGVGSYHKAISLIKELQIDLAIKEAVLGRKKKILGICLGMQLLGKSSTEDKFSYGLELLDFEVDYFNDSSFSNLKIPHVGFNSVINNDNSILMNSLPSQTDFYFVHSFRAIPNNLIGKHLTCSHGELFLAGIEYENIFGTQFHPEKSQTNGLTLLKNFINF